MCHHHGFDHALADPRRLPGLIQPTIMFERGGELRIEEAKIAGKETRRDLMGGNRQCHLMRRKSDNLCPANKC